MRPTATRATTAPGSARRGVAPLVVPDATGRLHFSTTQHVSFTLPSGPWRAPRAGDGKYFYSGTYFRKYRVHGRRCRVMLTFAARGRRQRPSLRVIRGSSEVARGRSEGTTWLRARLALPPVGMTIYARGSRPAPDGVDWRWLESEVGTQVVGQRRPAACVRSAARVDVAAAIVTARVADGGLPRLPITGQ